MAVDRIFWPFRVNWRDPYRISYEFRTDMLTVEAGFEQRRALRSTPRKTVRHSALLHRDDLRAFNLIVDRAQNLPVVIPEATRSRFVSQGNGVNISLVDVAPNWLIPGCEVFLSSLSRAGRVATVGAVNGTAVTLQTDEGSWDSTARLAPALTGLLSGDLATRRVTGETATASVELAVEPTSELYQATTPPLTFVGREILTHRPNWQNGIEVTHSWPVENVDFNFGKIVTYRDVNFPTVARNEAHVFRTPPEAEAMVDMFVRCRGQRTSFWASTRESDMTPVAALNSGAVTLTVAGDRVREYAGDPVRSAISLRLTDGSTLYRYIINMVPSDANSQLVVTEPWPRKISVSEISTISWILNTRFATDTLEMEWLTTSVARSQLTTRSLPLVGMPDFIGTRATLADDTRETLPGDDRAVVYL